MHGRRSEFWVLGLSVLLATAAAAYVFLSRQRLHEEPAETTAAASAPAGPTGLSLVDLSGLGALPRVELAGEERTLLLETPTAALRITVPAESRSDAPVTAEVRDPSGAESRVASRMSSGRLEFLVAAAAPLASGRYELEVTTGNGTRRYAFRLKVQDPEAK